MDIIGKNAPERGGASWDGRAPISAMSVVLVLTLSLGAGDKKVEPARLGDLQVTATAVDTGPVAAAEARAWWQPSADQFVIVRIAFKDVERRAFCTSFTTRLVSDSGLEYLPGMDTSKGGPRPGIITRTDGEEASYVFKVRDGSRPPALILERDTEAENACRSNQIPPLPPVGPQTARLSLDGLPMTDDIAVLVQHNHLARVGQLRVNATAVAAAPILKHNVTLQRAAGHGRHFVLVSMGVKNVSRHPNCTYFIPTLLVDKGYEYRPLESWPLGSPVGGGVLPGEAGGGIYTFEVHDGTKPLALSLRRLLEWERSCAEPQHRPVDMSGGAAVRIPLNALATLTKGHPQ